MFRTTQTVVARYQLKRDGKGGISGQDLFSELTAAFGQDHAVLHSMQDCCLDAAEPVEVGFPQRFAFFDPFPGDRIVPMYGIIVPRHLSSRVPGMPPLVGNLLGPHPHHVESRSDQDQFLNSWELLCHQPGDPAAQ